MRASGPAQSAKTFESLSPDSPAGLPSDIIASDLVSGASLLGDGTVVLILNVPAVLQRLSRSVPLGAIA